MAQQAETGGPRVAVSVHMAARSFCQWTQFPGFSSVLLSSFISSFWPDTFAPHYKWVKPCGWFEFVPVAIHGRMCVARLTVWEHNC